MSGPPALGELRWWISTVAANQPVWSPRSTPCCRSPSPPLMYRRLSGDHLSRTADPLRSHHIRRDGGVAPSRRNVGPADRRRPDNSPRCVLCDDSGEHAAARGGRVDRHYSGSAGPDRFKSGGIKIFADGGYSSRNAASRTPYVRDHSPRPGYRGRLNLTYSALREAIDISRAFGVQLAVHTNGTRAQDEILAAVADSPRLSSHRRVRVEHLGNVLGAADDVARWRTTGVIPVLQPAFLYNFVGDYVPMLLGDAGMTGRLALRTILDEGVIPAASSDIGLGAEIEQSNPLLESGVVSPDRVIGVGRSSPSRRSVSPRRCACSPSRGRVLWVWSIRSDRWRSANTPTSSSSIAIRGPPRSIAPYLS